jgi:hypothetical protein
VKPWEAVT